MATHEPSIATGLKLGPEDHGRRVSGEEFASADFVEPWQYERAEGRLIVMAPDGEEHTNFSEPWRDWLGAYRLGHPDVVRKVASHAWVRSRDTDRVGDIGVYLASDQLAPIPDCVHEIMFEVVSPGREAHERDYVEKRAEYYRIGVREYVVIDRFEKRVTVFTHAENGYEERVLTLADTYTSPLLPGLAIPLAEVIRQ